ncbi:MAG TPA: FapA family protein [Spirochaetia bacterium]|nr:FapA family protein [Spirochaetia bacterium]
MARDKEPTLDSLLEATEQLLNNVQNAERLVADLPDQTIADINSQMRLSEFESLNSSLGLQVDARVEIHVSIDDMLSTGDFFPPIAGGKKLDLGEIEKLLAGKGIVYGVSWENVRDAVLRCNTDGIEIDGVVVAEGKKPVPETPEHLIVNRRLIEPPPPVPLDGARVEHKERSPFVLVQKGEILAKRIPRQKGESGWTVYGKELTSTSKLMVGLSPGKNTEEGPDGIFAARSGRFILEKKSFFVTPLLEIQNDVDYSTGHIDFDGDIVIRGDVKDGFNIKATGSIYCSKTVSASHVQCEGDLIINRGIIGRQSGEVRVGGAIKCKYIEHCYVESIGPISTTVGMMNSVVKTNDRFETGARGIVVGGKLFAQNGVSVTQLGTSMGPSTEVYCGIDHTVQSRLEWIRDRNLELATRLTEVRAKVKSKGDPTGKLVELEKRLREAVSKLNTMSMALVGHLDMNEKASVMVRDAVYPNTYIEICHVSFVVSRLLRSVVFKLDREHGKIVHESVV